jgi:hypothetical protein
VIWGRRRDPHAPFLELLSRQLDEPLRLDESWQLSVHLSRCERCRAAEREYRDQRRALRALSPRPAPRDMWARTSAALDREMARPWRAARHENPARTRRATGRRRAATYGGAVPLAATLAAAGAVAALTITQLPIFERAEPTRLRSTPFAVPGQSVAFVGAGPDGFSIYSANVDHVCPIAASDCEGHSAAPSMIRLPSAIEPSRLALSPTGRQLAVSGRDADRDAVFAIVTMPERPPADGPRPTAPGDSTRTPPPVATPRPPSGPTLEPEVSPAATPGLIVQAILEDAVGVGAPAAWSSDGQMLAFSAMPSDGSRGPDLFIWRPGDLRAARLTSDQGTYFASWSGGRIVASRVTVNESGLPEVTTWVIDPVSGDERAVDSPAMWLPQVNAPGTHAIAWQGSLAWRANTVTPEVGGLYLVEWAAVDPFAPAVPPRPTGEPQPGDPGQTTAPSLDASPRPGDEPVEPTAEAEPSLAPTGTPLLLTLPPRDGVDPTQAVPTTPAPETTPSQPTAEPPRAAPTARATPSSADDVIVQALLPGRDPVQSPVRDWEVRWSPDGALVGFWIADAPGSSWGQLLVVPLDPELGRLALDDALLPATLARRSFSVGTDRVAWVAPVEHSPDGELRVTAWGPDGFGVMRLPAPEVDGAVAPF